MSRSLSNSGGESPVKTFRCDTARWDRFKAHCNSKGEKHSVVLRDLIEGYLWAELGDQEVPEVLDHSSEDPASWRAPNSTESR